MIESLLLNNTSNCFNFILSSEPGKKPVASIAKWNDDYTFRNTRAVDNMFL